MKDGQEAQTKEPINIGIVDSKEEAPSSISLSNVGENESNEVNECQTQKLDIEVEANNNDEPRNSSEEVKAVSEISSNHSSKEDSSQDFECVCTTEESPKNSSIESEDEIGTNEDSKSEEEFLDRRSEDEKSESVEGQEQPKKVPLSNNSGTNEDFWDSLAEEYMYGESEAGEFSFRCEDEVDEPKSEDSDLPEHHYFAAAALIDTWVSKTAIRGSESEIQSEGNKIKETDFLDRLHLSHVTEPNRQYSIMAKTEDWYFSSDEETVTLTSVDSVDSGLESEESKKEDLVIQDMDLISQSLDPEHQMTPDLEDFGKQTGSNLGERMSRSALEKGTGVAPCVGFLQRCIGWIRKMRRRRVRVAPVELFEPQVLSTPNSSNVKTGKEQCPSNSGKVNRQVSPSSSFQCQPIKVARQTFSSSCVPDSTKTKMSGPRKLKAKHRMTPDLCQPGNLSSSCKSEKVKTEKTPGHCKTKNLKMIKISVESLSGKSLYPRPRKLAMRQEQTSPCDSLYGDVTLRRRKERAGSQGWIRYPRRN